METPFKVWKIGSNLHGWSLVAVKSQKAAAELFGVRVAAIPKFAVKVTDPDTVELAVANAGRVLKAPGGLVAYSASDFV